MSALQDLHGSIDEFANRVAGLPDSGLEKPWRWGDYDEGVRFIFFRIYETLRGLTAEALSLRAASGRPLTRAQAILGGYQAAFRRFQGIVLGIEDGLASQPPADKEWPLRTVAAHMLGAELSFWKINAEALEAVRQGSPQPPPVTDEAWEAYESGEPIFKHLEAAPLSVLLADYGVLNQRTLQTFTRLSDQELETKVWFWESQPMPLHFRLRRFESHIVQHTVQAEKTLAALDYPLTESRRLLFLIYQALAGCEEALLGAEMDDASVTVQAAREIGDYVAQAVRALA